MPVKNCPFCGVKVVVLADGLCTLCHKPIEESGSVAITDNQKKSVAPFGKNQKDANKEPQTSPLKIVITILFLVFLLGAFSGLFKRGPRGLPYSVPCLVCRSGDFNSVYKDPFGWKFKCGVCNQDYFIAKCQSCGQWDGPTYAFGTKPPEAASHWRCSKCGNTTGY